MTHTVLLKPYDSYCMNQISLRYYYHCLGMVKAPVHALVEMVIRHKKGCKGEYAKTQRYDCETQQTHAQTIKIQREG